MIIWHDKRFKVSVIFGRFFQVLDDSRSAHVPSLIGMVVHEDT